MKMNNMKYIRTSSFISLATVITAITVSAHAVTPAPVPGYVPPVTMGQAPAYADDTRGVYVPAHTQHRLKTADELNSYDNPYGASFQLASADYTGPENLVSDAYSSDHVMEQELNRISNGHAGYADQLQNIAAAPLPQNQPARVYQPMMEQQLANQPSLADQPHKSYNVAMQAPQAPAPQAFTPQKTSTGGVEIARGSVQRKVLDMQNGIVRLREDRISVRRALQRMMDQIGGGEWTVIWDMAEQNAALPDMEVSVYAEEPFMNVINALLARIQTRSGQPLRVIRYDNTQRLIITDRAGGHRMAGKVSSVGVGENEEVAVTETVLKEAMVTLHFDEVPLVDALENIVNQAGRGEWRLRVYAGLDQVLKPAHIEEPFNVAMERVLKLFNLKYEIFPGGKLIVITHNNRFGYKGVQ